jgi:hypothetical protein
VRGRAGRGGPLGREGSSRARTRMRAHAAACRPPRAPPPPRRDPAQGAPPRGRAPGGGQGDQDHRADGEAEGARAPPPWGARAMRARHAGAPCGALCGHLGRLLQRRGAPLRAGRKGRGVGGWTLRPRGVDPSGPKGRAPYPARRPPRVPLPRPGRPPPAVPTAHMRPMRPPCDPCAPHATPGRHHGRGRGARQARPPQHRPLPRLLQRRGAACSPARSAPAHSPARSLARSLAWLAPP